MAQSRIDFGVSRARLGAVGIVGVILGLICLVVLIRYRAFIPQVVPLASLVAAFGFVYLFPRYAVVVSIPLLLLQQTLPAIAQVNRVPLLITAAWVVGLIQGRWSITRFHLLSGFLILLLGIAYTWAPIGHSFGPGYTGFIELLSGIALASAVSSIRPPAWLVVGAIAATGAFASTSVVFGGFGNSSSVLVDYGNYFRAVAFGLNSNYLGVVVALGFTAVISLTLLRRQPLLLLLTLPMLIVQPALKSRSSLGLLVLGLVLAVAFYVGFRRSILLLVIGVVVALAFSTSIDSIYQTALGARSNVDLSDSDSIRAATVPLAVRVGIEYPLLGIGDGNFQAFAEDSESIGTAVNTHNDYLRLFAEFGLPSLVALILMLASGLSRAVRSESAALVMPVLIVFLVSLLFGNHLSALAVSGGFWVLLGVAASLPRIRPVGHATYGQVARFAT